MVRRDLSTTETVTNVEAPLTGSAQLAIAEAGQAIMGQAQEAKISENMSKAQLEISALDNDFRINNQADPFNKEASMSYQTNRKEITDRYGQEISPMYRMQWNNSARGITGKSDAANKVWQMKQSGVNTVSSINTSMQNSFMQANQDGQVFGSSADIEPDSIFKYMSSMESLTSFGNKHLGEVSTSKLMATYKQDYFKSFIVGAADSNPAKAADLIATDEVKALFDSEELNEFEGLIRKNIKQQSIDTLLAVDTNESAAVALVNSKELGYFAKRLKIDTMELDGDISKAVATKSRRVLTSAKAVQELTNSEEMGSIINQMYDLNATQEMDSEGYLLGVRNIKEGILDSQAKGDLSPSDAKKLNGQLKQLTAQKTAEATQRVGINFYEAKEKFNVLPPQFRGEAIRDLFYKTEGREDVSDAEYARHSNSIIDAFQRRSRLSAQETAKKAVQRTQAANTLFLTKHKITAEQLKSTAENRGLTEQQVMRALKEKLGE